MAQVTITINAREYAIACEDGQEFRIMQLARILDEKARLLTDGGNQISERRLLAMVGLLLADEISELKKNAGKNESTPSADIAESVAKIDTELAESVKNLSGKLKVLANEINLL